MDHNNNDDGRRPWRPTNLKEESYLFEYYREKIANEKGKLPEDVPDKEVDERVELEREYDEEEGDEEEAEGDRDEEESKEGKGEEEEHEGNETEEEKIDAEALKSPRTPGSDRQARERKTVERFIASETARGSASKPLAIEKGRGIQLKDIPNVASKLSKRKADENLQLLHTILYGKKAKVHTLKNNIGLFSGFIWVENEEKQRAKVKEKIDKCVKEKLLDFCDVLDISTNKATIKKEELSAKLLDFLESPRVTIYTLLADKEKDKKRKSKVSANKSPSSNVTTGKFTKKQKSDSGSGKKRKNSTEEVDDDKGECSQSEDDQDDGNTVPQAESGEEENDSGEETDEDQDEPQKQISAKKSVKSKSVSIGISVKASKSSGKSTKKASSSVSKKGVAEAETKGKSKVPLTKKQKVGKESDEDTSAPAINTSSSKKTSSKYSAKASRKDQGGKSKKNVVKEPTKEEMHAVVSAILKEVYFNTATLSNILRQLGENFGINLLHRKSEVKQIITDVINSMYDEEDEEEAAEESGDESGKAEENNDDDDDDA